MRYALMSEPQQGLTYDEILALARAAEAAGLEAYLPLGPLRIVPRAGRPADHRRLGHARRPCPRHLADSASGRSSAR